MAEIGEDNKNPKKTLKNETMPRAFGGILGISLAIMFQKKEKPSTLTFFWMAQRKLPSSADPTSNPWPKPPTKLSTTFQPVLGVFRQTHSRPLSLFYSLFSYRLGTHSLFFLFCPLSFFVLFLFFTVQLQAIHVVSPAIPFLGSAAPCHYPGLMTMISTKYSKRKPHLTIKWSFGAANWKNTHAIFSSFTQPNNVIRYILIEIIFKTSGDENKSSQYKRLRMTLNLKFLVFEINDDTTKAQKQLICRQFEFWTHCLHKLTLA